MTYTPGPWHISSTDSGKSWNVGARDCTNVCIVHGPEENGPDEYTANARLIAAAPAMAEVLRPIALQATYYKPELPHCQMVEIPLDFLRAALSVLTQAGIEPGLPDHIAPPATEE